MSDLVLKLAKSNGLSINWPNNIPILLEPSPAYALRLLPAISTTAQDALRKPLFLSEFETPSDKAAARTNLELQIIDLGEFN